MLKYITVVEKGSWKSSFKSVNNWKVKNHCYYTGIYGNAAYSIWNLKFNVPNEILAVFHNGSNSCYHFIIKELAK